MATPSHVAELLKDTPVVAPSMLASDFANLQGEIGRLEQAGARVLHLDIMDGCFVPNLSFGIPVVEAIRRVTDLVLDVHLMISAPDKYLGPFRQAGADMLTVHVEAVEDPRPLLTQIHDLGAAAGLALNPPTPIETIEPYLDLCDLILPMSVMPGFGGQEFQDNVLNKLSWVRRRVDGRALVSVDGGVNLATIGRCVGAGANLLVTGTALLGHDDYAQQLDSLLRSATTSENSWN